MINKVAFKKFIKDEFYIDEKNNLVTDGCAAYVITPDIQKILDNFKSKGGEFKSLDLSKFINLDYLEGSELIKTSGLIEKNDGRIARVMMDFNGKNHQLDQKYIDILDKQQKITYRQAKEFSPVYCIDKNNVLIAVILPMRTDDDEYEINNKGGLAEANSQWARLNKENSEIYRKLERISPEVAKEWLLKNYQELNGEMSF